MANHDSETWERLSDQFHLTFYQYADNSRLSETIRRIRLQFALFSNAYQQIPDNQREIQQEHDQILSHLIAQDDTAAEQTLRCHLAASKEKAFALYGQNVSGV